MKERIISSLAILAVSCNSHPDQKFETKKQIGLCEQNQGMVAFVANFYADSTFYIPEDKGFIGYSSGNFKISSDTIYFETDQGENHLCEKYLIQKADGILIPVNCPNNSQLTISFY